MLSDFMKKAPKRSVSAHKDDGPDIIEDDPHNTYGEVDKDMRQKVIDERLRQGIRQIVRHELALDPVARERAVEMERERLAISEQARAELAAGERPPIPSSQTLADVMATAVDTPRMRIDTALRVDQRLLIIAQAKAGKTTLTSNLAEALIDGNDLFAEFEVQAITEGNVVLLDFELTHDEVQAFYGRIQNKDRLRVYEMFGKGAAFNLLDPVCRREWSERLRADDARYVVWDCMSPVVKALGLSETTDLGTLAQAFGVMCAEAGVTEMAVVHHAGHTSLSNPTVRARGDSGLLGWYTAQWTLRMTSGEQRLLDIDGRLLPTTKGLPLVHHADQSLTLMPLGEYKAKHRESTSSEDGGGRRKPGPHAKDRAAQILEALAGGKTYRIKSDLIKAVGGTTDKVSKAIDALEKEGRITSGPYRDLTWEGEYLPTGEAR